jgi:hypothetical protein
MGQQSEVEMAISPHINRDDLVPTAVWVLDAPWAHPVWSQYVVSVADITGPAEDGTQQIHYAEGVTHELVVLACDPAWPVDTACGLKGQEVSLLTPPNHAYQFKAADIDAAVARVQLLVDMIERRHLSPDSDFAASWDRYFADGVSLRIEGGGLH